MTGRAAGYCAGYPVPGFANPIPGHRYGFGFGRGMGFGFRGGRGGRWAVPYYGHPTPYAVPYASAPTPQQEVETLQGQAEYLENTLAEIKKRIAELEIDASKE